MTSNHTIFYDNGCLLNKKYICLLNNKTKVQSLIINHFSFRTTFSTAPLGKVDSPASISSGIGCFAVGG